VTTTDGIGQLENGKVRLLKTEHADLGAALKMGANLADLAKAAVREERDLSEVRLLAPIPRPSKIWAVGWAYKKHKEEVKNAQELNDPFIFLKAPSSIIATAEPIRLPAVAPDKVDYEGELTVIIGRQACGVSAADGMDYVAGYSIGNDVSARDVQKGDKADRMANVSLGKSFDTFTPLGPSLTTLDEFQDPNDIELKTYVDGELRQQARTSDLIYPVAELVSYASIYTTLEPGDLILTGTPAGVGHPAGRFLKAGSEIRIEIEGIGALENTVENA
jgi:2-keto-4-pentenoate hydratase/2-oxohepta-3-ene-1,7-dioic acid hydratase in catechol pathway